MKLLALVADAYCAACFRVASWQARRRSAAAFRRRMRSVLRGRP